MVQIPDPPVRGFATDSLVGSLGKRVALGSFCHSIFSTTAPDYDRSQWLNEKFKLGLDFPNVGAEAGALWDTEPCLELCLYSEISFPSLHRGFRIEASAQPLSFLVLFSAFP